MLKFLSRLLDSSRPEKVSRNNRKKNNSRRLKMEFLEERTLLDAGGIDFASPEPFTYTPNENTGIQLELQQMDFITVIDMNGDGKDDIIACNTGTGTGTSGPIYFYKGLGNGEYDSPVEMLSGIGMSSADLLLGDVTGDGVPDLILVPKSDNGKISIYQGTKGNQSTSPSFASVATTIDRSWSSISPSGVTMMSINKHILADIDNNGTLDIVASATIWKSNASQSPVEAIFYFSGTGNSSNPFNSTAVELKKSDGTSFTEKLLGVGKYNGSNPGMLVYDSSDASLDFYSPVSNESTNFKITDTLAKDDSLNKYTIKNSAQGIVSNAGGTSFVTAVQVDFKDGSDGIALIGLNSNNKATISFIETDVVPSNIAIGNLNDKTAFKEIIVSNGSLFQVLNWEPSLGSGGAYEPAPSVTSNALYFKTLVGDFNRDGTQDILAVGKHIITFFPGGNMDDPYHLDIDTLIFSRGISDAALTDLNGDGTLDLITISQGSIITVFEGSIDTVTKTPKFTKKSSNVLEGSPSNLQFGRFFSDYLSGSKNDLFFTTEIVSGWRFNFWQFDENFNIIKRNTHDLENIRTLTNSLSVAIGNLGGNNNLDDFVVVDRVNCDVRIYNNSGNGSFNDGDKITIGTVGTSLSSAIAIADLDQSGVPAIIALNSGNRRYDNGTGEMVILYKSGNNYQSIRNNYFPVGGNPNSITIGDLDGDEDGYSDILVGLNNDNRFVIFRNLNGVMSRDAVSINTGVYSGFETGSIGTSIARVDANASNDIVIVSGNKVRLIKNNTVFASQSAQIQIEFRMLENSTIPSGDVADPSQYQPNGSLSWVDEWSSFYIDIWASSSDQENGIISFDSCALNFDPSLFRIESVQKGPSFSSVTMKQTADGTVVLEGTADGTGGKDGNYTLMARVLVRPAIGTGSDAGANLGIKFEYDQLTSVSNVFSIGSDMKVQTKNSSKAGEVMLGTIPSLDVYPVIFDFDDSGNVNFNDLLNFLTIYGKNIENTPEKIMMDFDLSKGKINFQDLLLFLKGYGTSRAKAQTATKTRYVTMPPSFPEAWSSTNVSTSAASISSETALPSVQSLSETVGSQGVQEFETSEYANISRTVDFTELKSDTFESPVYTEFSVSFSSTSYDIVGIDTFYEISQNNPYTPVLTSARNESEQEFHSNYMEFFEEIAQNTQEPLFEQYFDQETLLDTAISSLFDE